MKALIIDDEAHIRNTLTTMLAKHCPQVKVVGEASGVSEGGCAVNSLRPDLVFLDINMLDGTGFDLVSLTCDIRFDLIFISSFNKQTILEMESKGFIYLQKPFNPVEIKMALGRIAPADTNT